MNKPWKVVLVFVGVFVAGAICGGPLAGRWLGPKHNVPRQPYRLQIMQRLEEDLKLTEAQKAKVRPIVQQAQEETQRLRRENVKAIAVVLEQMHTQVAAELTPEQKVKLEQMRKDLRERADRMRREFRDHERPPGPPPDEPPPPPPGPEPLK